MHTQSLANFPLLASCQWVTTPRTSMHTFSQPQSELTLSLANSQNHNASYARRQASVSSGCVCVCVARLMIHGITVVVPQWRGCVCYESGWLCLKELLFWYFPLYTHNVQKHTNILCFIFLYLFLY